MKPLAVLLILCSAALVMALLLIRISEVSVPLESKAISIAIVENELAGMIDVLPESEFRNQAQIALNNFHHGKPISRDFLLSVATIIGLEIPEDIPTQELIDLLAKAYYETR